MDLNLSKGIWERTGTNEIGKHAYAATVSIAFMWAILLVSGAAAMAFTWPFSWPLLIGTFVAAIAGIVIFSASDSPFISFVGVSVLSVALGFMIGPVVALYALPVVVKALVTTAGVTVLMSVLGIVYPKSLEGLGGFLLGGLMLLIAGNLARIFLPMFGIPSEALGILDWVGAGLFTVYIVYDWNRAMRLPYTIDNAIDTSGALILDVVNLFLYLLRLFGGSGSKSSK